MSGNLERRVAYLEKMVEELSSLALDQSVIIKKLLMAEYPLAGFHDDDPRRWGYIAGFANSLRVIANRHFVRRSMVGGGERLG
jgi:hypothetical protein